MSAETLQHLNLNTLIGMTDKRGKAWHYRADLQNGESNHYPGAIPIEDVSSRLFNWRAIELPIFAAAPASLADATGMDPAGSPVRAIAMPDRKAIATSDTNEVLGVFSGKYEVHQYADWLIKNVESILDDDLAISSAGLLRSRKIAWVEVSVPENVVTPEGIEFRPNLLACTSHDGTISTTYKRTVQLTVCDNTMAAALGEAGQQIKIRHSKNSLLRLGDARDALAIVYENADAFAAEVGRLTAQKVTDAEWDRVLHALVPISDSKAGATAAKAKQARLDSMYRNDERVAPWKGTAFGVLQAFNTWRHHEQPTRGETVRAERNMINALDGEGEKSDGRVLAALAGV